MTLGKKIQTLRKEMGITQEEMANQLKISSQAVSKWETDVSSPDISILRDLADMLNVTVDQLLSPEDQPVVRMIEKPNSKRLEEMIFHLRVQSDEGDQIKINLPLPLIQMMIEMNMDMTQVGGRNILKRTDVEKVLMLVEKGAIGKLLEIQSADGDQIEFVVE